MGFKRVWAWAGVALLLGGCAAPATTVTAREEPRREVRRVPTAQRKAIAVAEFVNRTPYGARRIGNAVSDILVGELVQTNAFRVFEREKLDLVLKEQKLQLSDLFDTRSAVRMGKLLGAHAVIIGSVSQFGVRTEGQDFILYRTKVQIAETTVDVRMIDVQTGEILLASTASGLAQKETQEALGVGGRMAYDETLEQKAIRVAVQKLVSLIVERAY